MISLRTRPLSVLTWSNMGTTAQTHPRVYWGSGSPGARKFGFGRYALPMGMTTKQLRVNVVENTIGTSLFVFFKILKNNSVVKSIKISGGTTGIFTNDDIVRWNKLNDIQFRVEINAGPCIPPLCPILPTTVVMPIFIAELDVIDVNNF